MGHAKQRLHALPPAPGAAQPTVGEIKRALAGLSQSSAAAAPGNRGALLREAHDQLRELAHHHGIDPDAALRRSLAAVESLRERLARASTATPDRKAG